MEDKRFSQRTPLCQPLVFRVAIAALFALICVVFWSPIITFACTPPVGGHPNYSIAYRAVRADLVIVGTVMDYTDDGFMGTATIQVDSYIKGSGLNQLVVTNLGTSALCLQPPPREGTYLFFADGDASSGEVRARYFGAGDAYVPATAANIEEATIAVRGGPTVTPTAETTPIVAAPVTVPEPISVVLFGTGVASLAGYVAVRRRKSGSADS